MKNKHKTASSCRTGSGKTKSKNINSYGYDVSKFTVLDIPVRREATTGRLVSIGKPSSRKKYK